MCATGTKPSRVKSLFVTFVDLDGETVSLLGAAPGRARAARLLRRVVEAAGYAVPSRISLVETWGSRRGGEVVRAEIPNGNRSPNARVSASTTEHRQ
jgi:hypothetical protein